MTSSERDLRVQLAAAYRIVDFFGLTSLIQNHISVRAPDRPDHFLINPYGLRYDEVTASSLVKIDLEGRVVEAGRGPFGRSVNPAGFVIHRAIHGAREDVACVVHTHTVAGAAVSAMECGLLPLCIEATHFTGSIAYHDFEGVTVRRDECARIAADLGSSNALILRNHGLLTAGKSVAEALIAIIKLERACQVQVAALSSGRPLVVVPSAIASQVPAQIDSFVPGTTIAELTFAAFTRLIDKRDPTYRE